MYKKIVGLSIVIALLVTTSNLFAQSYQFSDSWPPRVLNENTASLWPAYTSGATITTPIFNYNANQSYLVGPFSSQSNEDTLITTYTGSSFGTFQRSSFNPLGTTSSTFSELKLPWVTVSTNISTSQNVGSIGFVPVQSASVKIQSQVSSQDNPYAGMNPHVAGIYALRDNALAGFALDKVLAEKPMYTGDGQKYYATASYYNPYNDSGYYFSNQTSTYIDQVTTVAGVPVESVSYRSNYYPNATYYPSHPDMSYIPTYYYGTHNTGIYANSSNYPTMLDEEVIAEEIEERAGDTNEEEDLNTAIRTAP
ncbi:MAG: hypothetical protein ACMUIP_05890 [bacterium]